jgi:starch phosphorylase
VDHLRGGDYNPYRIYENDPELKRVIDQIATGLFSPSDPHLFTPIVDALLRNGDYFLLLVDYRSYIEAQERVDQLFDDKDEWTRKTILNTANMGKFSSDRAVMEYAEKIWGVQPLDM